MLKIVENAYNSVPIGYSYDRDQDNTSMLKIICPNMLRMGRTNQRTLEGPIRLARGARELLTKVEELYDAWFKVWQDTVVPKLIFQPKWYDGHRDLQEGDLVYFQKKESKLDNKWTVGKVDQVVRGRDQKIRKVIIKYKNASEENTFRFTERSVRKLVKLFSIDEHQIQEDLSELQKRIDRLQDPGLAGEGVEVDEPSLLGDGGGDEPVVVQVDELGQSVGDHQQGLADTQVVENELVDANNGDEAGQQDEVGVDVQQEQRQAQDVPAASTRSKKRCSCCCSSHCKFSFHTKGPDVRAYTSTRLVPLA